MNIQNLTARSTQIAFTLLLLLTSAANTQSQTKKLTIEWVFGAEGRAVASLPQTAWLDDGTFIMLDNRRPTRQQKLPTLWLRRVG